MNKLWAIAAASAALIIPAVPHVAVAQGVYGAPGACGVTPVQTGLGANMVVDSTTGLLCTGATTTPSGTQTTQPLGVTSTDASGTVTLGNTYQTLQASTPTRKGCTIQNPTTATEVLSVRVGTTTVFNLTAGSSLNCQIGGIVVTDAIAVTAATTAHTFSANFQ